MTTRNLARITARWLAALAAALACCLALAPARALAGTLTVAESDANAGLTYDAWQLLDAEVTAESDGTRTAANVSWHSNAARAAVELVADASFDTAQDAADWLAANLTEGTVRYELADALSATTPDVSAVAPGEATALADGYWLLSLDDPSGRAATAPVFVLVGGSAQTVAPKDVTPTAGKSVRDSADATWHHAASATVGDSLAWRIEATVPAGLEGYDTYEVTFTDVMAEGIDASQAAATARLYVRAGVDGSFDDAEAQEDGWRQVGLPAGSAVVDGQTLTVTVPDLVATLRGLNAELSGGAQLCVTYDAPLAASAKRGATRGNANTVTVEYPTSPSTDARGTTTPAKAVAYTWDLVITKRSSESEDAVLAGAELCIRDAAGRCLAADGTWVTGDATVTTGADGTLSVSGVAPGTFTVEEVKAPKGYDAFSGTRAVTFEVAGIDVASSANARVTLKAGVEEPLRVDAVSAKTGQVSVTLLNEPTAGGGASGGSGRGGSGLLSYTGDASSLAAAGAVAAVGAGALAFGLVTRRRRRGGDA